MNKWKLYIIVGAVSFALFGLIVVQSTFIKRSVYIQEQFFDQHVKEAMLRVAVNIEEREAYSFFNQQKQFIPNTTSQHFSPNLDESYSLIFENDTFTAEIYKNDSLFRISSHDLLELDEKIKDLNLHFSVTGKNGDQEHDLLNYSKQMFSSNFQLNFNDESYQLITDSSDLHNIILYELKRSGINLPFNYALLDGFSLNELSSNCSDKICPDFFKKAYKTNVLINGFTGSEAYLLIDFPKKRNFILKSNSTLLIYSFIFILLILASFIVSWYIIFSQKMLSELKTDFINNMTHELKTPVATISLASEMLGNPKIQQNPEKLKNYTQIIKEENIRLGSHIEKVLQTAQLDKEAIKLNKTAVDMHYLLQELYKKFELRILDADAEIRWHLNATDAIVMVDNVHFLNILSNLLDNALKYRKPEKLVIDIATSNVKNGLRIELKDNGIGMTKANAKRIFEKFYRVPTGNIHNVKGFGLGLSYVKTMIDEHNGKISIDTELDKYTNFIIELETLDNPTQKCK